MNYHFRLIHIVFTRTFRNIPFNLLRHLTAGTAQSVQLLATDLESPRIESRWTDDILCNRPGKVSLVRVKRNEYGANHSPTPSVEVKGRVELCLYSPRLVLHSLLQATV